MNWKTIAVLVGIAAGAFSIAVSWVALGLPIYATRGFVKEEIRPVIFRQLAMHRHVNNIDLFQWESNHPVPRSREIQEIIDQLRSEITDIDRQIAEIRTQRR